MPDVSQWQARIIANFLESSRRLFGMPARRHFARATVEECRRRALRSLLIAGSIGSLVGNAALARENGDGASQPAPDRPSRAAPASPLSGSPAIRALFERMP